MYTFEDLKQIMKTLRAEDGCPWDRSQDSGQRRLLDISISPHISLSAELLWRRL